MTILTTYHYPNIRFSLEIPAKANTYGELVAIYVRLPKENLVEVTLDDRNTFTRRSLFYNMKKKEGDKIVLTENDTATLQVFVSFRYFNFKFLLYIL